MSREIEREKHKTRHWSKLIFFILILYKRVSMSSYGSVSIPKWQHFVWKKKYKTKTNPMYIIVQSQKKNVFIRRRRETKTQSMECWVMKNYYCIPCRMSAFLLIVAWNAFHFFFLKKKLCVHWTWWRYLVKSKVSKRDEKSNINIVK